MLAIAKMGRSSRYYYASLAQSSYEASSALPGEPPAVWGGTGAVQFGLCGAVNRAEFFALFDGFSPDHESKLVENAGGKRRVPGWDLVFTPPKSVSMLWAVVDPVSRAVVENLHHRAVESAIAYMESHARLLTHDAPPIGLTVAYFEHGSNRAGDPNLHTHALVLNDGVTHDGVTGPIDSRVLYQHKMAAGALYRSELAALLQTELGLALERCQSWFELEGFSRTSGRYQKLMNLWSSRRQEIEAHQPSTAAQAQAVAYMTRDKKGYVPPRDELFQAWQEVAAQYGFSPRKATRLILPEGKEQLTLWQKFQAWRTLREARRIVVMHQSHFSRRDLVTAIAVAAQARGLNSVDVLRLTDTCLRHRQVMSIGIVKDEERFTLKRLYRLEQSLLMQANKLAMASGMRVSHRQVERAGITQSLSVEQRRALHTLTEGGKLKVLSGISGTGKTQTLIAAAKAHRNNGYTVVAVSPSRQGAENLRESGLESQGVLSKLLYGEVERSITIQKLFYEIDRAQEGKRRYGSRSYAKDPLSRKTVVMVDEAQALSTAQMLRLVEEVNRAGGKLILSGDIKAPQAFEHSGAFKALTQKISSSVTLTEINRQEPSLSRDLVHGIGAGKVAMVANLLRDETIFHLSETMEEAQAQLIADWLPQAIAHPKDNLIIVDSKEEAATLNAMAQKALRQAGALSDAALKTKTGYFRVGDRVMFHETSPTYGVTKGNTGTIERFESLTKVAVIRLDSGKTRLLNLRHYKGLSLAYALTPSEAKHKEVRNGFVLTQGRGRDISLVQASRAKTSTEVYSYASKHEREETDTEWRIGRQMTVQKEVDLAIVAEESQTDRPEKQQQQRGR
jgi:conjugative relaxase-like TrwC/TraI family protein